MMKSIEFKRKQRNKSQINFQPKHGHATKESAEEIQEKLMQIQEADDTKENNGYLIKRHKRNLSVKQLIKNHRQTYQIKNLQMLNNLENKVKEQWKTIKIIWIINCLKNINLVLLISSS